MAAFLTPSPPPLSNYLLLGFPPLAHPICTSPLLPHQSGITTPRAQLTKKRVKKKHTPVSLNDVDALAILRFIRHFVFTRHDEGGVFNHTKNMITKKLFKVQLILNNGYTKKEDQRLEKNMIKEMCV